MNVDRLGIGVALHYLAGGSKHDPSEYYGKTVFRAWIENECLKLVLDDSKEIHIWDDGQSCCEARYMTCDDNPSDLVGGKLVNIEAKEGPEIEGNFGDLHEQVFVEIATDKGFITVVSHNEHNGYYGGFGLTITEN